MPNLVKLDELTVYRIALDLSNYVWDVVSKWDYFSKDTVGTQLVKALDSVSANIAEGFGRYYKKDKIKFYYYAKGSLSECFDWIEKAHTRGLLSNDNYNHIKKNLNLLPKEINILIKLTNENLKI